MRSAWLVGVMYWTGGIIAEEIAVVNKKTKPTKREMKAIFHSKRRAQAWDQVTEIYANKIEVIEL